MDLLHDNGPVQDQHLVFDSCIITTLFLSCWSMEGGFFFILVKLGSRRENRKPCIGR
uniref:Uncharacterized protein n=1 Tax=Tetranychus urticae TaxID=32264 RepID=T1KRE6_TETUR